MRENKAQQVEGGLRLAMSVCVWIGGKEGEGGSRGDRHPVGARRLWDTGKATRQPVSQPVSVAPVGSVLARVG